MSKKLRYSGAGLLLVAGLGLAFVRVDRQFINLGATTGQQHRVVLQSEHTYRQEFQVTRDSISTVGLHFRRLNESLPQKAATIRIWQREKLLAEQALPLVFLLQEDATHITFAEPISVMPGERAAIEITIPPVLSNKVALQTREVDDSFSHESVSFFIDGRLHPEPLGYQLFSSYQPPLAMQLAGLSWIVALYMLLPPRTVWQKRVWLTGYALVAAGLFAWPAIFDRKLVLILLSAFMLIAAYTLLRRVPIEPATALFGAHILAFSSWLPLHLLAAKLPATPMSARDIFLDPNQVLVDHAAGSYVGIFAVVFAIIGLTAGRRYYLLLGVGLLAALVAMLPSLAIPSVIILTTAVIAFFAGVGLQAFKHYLGEYDRLVTILVYGIVSLSLLDLWHVAATTLGQSSL